MIYQKICNCALFMTSIFVFITWSLIDTIDFSNFDNIISEIIAGYIIKFVLAFGFFNSIVLVTVYFFDKIPFMKKIIFGSSFFEGVWVGYYTVEDTHVIF